MQNLVVDLFCYLHHFPTNTHVRTTVILRLIDLDLMDHPLDIKMYSTTVPVPVPGTW